MYCKINTQQFVHFFSVPQYITSSLYQTRVEMKSNPNSTSGSMYELGHCLISVAFMEKHMFIVYK